MRNQDLKLRTSDSDQRTAAAHLGGRTGLRPARVSDSNGLTHYEQRNERNEDAALKRHSLRTVIANDGIVPKQFR
jgi:hypothetical protein